MRLIRNGGDEEGKCETFSILLACVCVCVCVCYSLMEGREEERKKEKKESQEGIKLAHDLNYIQK